MTNSILMVPQKLASMFIYMIFITALAAEPNAKAPPKPDLNALSLIEADVFTRQINQSKSPNKKWVAAIGTRDWKKPKWHVSSDQQEEGSKKASYMLDDQNVANYLISTAANRVVAVLDGDHFGTLTNYNHESASYVWSPDSRWLVENQDWKWHTGTCSVHHLNAKGKWQSRLNLLQEATKIVDDWLKKNAPKLSADDRQSYAIRAGINKIANDGNFTLKVSAEVPKAEESEYVDLSVLGVIKVKADGGLAFSVTSIKPAGP